MKIHKTSRICAMEITLAKRVYIMVVLCVCTCIDVYLCLHLHREEGEGSTLSQPVDKTNKIVVIMGRVYWKTHTHTHTPCVSVRLSQDREQQTLSPPCSESFRWRWKGLNAHTCIYIAQSCANDTSTHVTSLLVHTLSNQQSRSFNA